MESKIVLPDSFPLISIADAFLIADVFLKKVHKASKHSLKQKKYLPNCL